MDEILCIFTLALGFSVNRAQAQVDSTEAGRFTIPGYLDPY